MKGKKVSNYELFFDLVFILATSGVVGILHSTPEHIVSFERILGFIVSTFIYLAYLAIGKFIFKSL